MNDTLLTTEQKRIWKDEGYVILKGVLSTREIIDLTAVVDQMYDEYLQQPDVKQNAVLDRRNVMEENDIFVKLIDHPVTFPIVLELMTPYILLGMSEVTVRPPDLEGKGILHTDGGQAMRQIRVTDSSLPLQIKIHYFLTDLHSKDSGNFTVVPGSHKRPFPESGFEEGPYLADAVQLCVNAGDAAIFSHALWHGFVANKSADARKTLIYCYVQQFLRAFDYQAASAELLARCTARQRRLIGDIGEWRPGSYFYSPPDQVQIVAGTEGIGSDE